MLRAFQIRLPDFWVYLSPPLEYGLMFVSLTRQDKKSRQKNTNDVKG
jgi:hypothetical protein